MRHEPQGDGVHRGGEDAVAVQLGHHLGRRAAGFDPPDHDVGADGRHPHAAAAGERLAEEARVLVVLGQAAHHRLQGYEPGRGENAHLAHAPPELLSHAAGGLDPIPGGDQQRPRRRAQSLRQRHHRRVRALQQALRLHAEGHRGVPDARAVDVHLQPRLPAGVHRIRRLLHGVVRAPREVVGVLEHGEADLGAVIDPRLHRGADVLRPEAPVLARHGPRYDAGQHGHARQLVLNDVATLFDQHLLAGDGEDADRDLVAHDPGGDPQGGLEAEHLRGHVLEAVDAGVLAVDVVADVGFGHRPPHLGRRLSHRVGTQINHDSVSLSGSFTFRKRKYRARS